jgi:flagellar biosynthetic protein FliR
MPAHWVTWSLGQFQSFLLILMRVAPILFMMPILGSRNVPALIKIALSLTVTLILLPLVSMNPRVFPAEPFHFAFFLLAELMIGLILALTIQFVLAGIQIGGEFAGFQMGLSMAEMMDPQSGTNANVVSQFNNMLALLIFLSIDGHHWFFRALAQSFQILQPGEIHLREGLYRQILQLGGQMFLIGLKIAAPAMAVLILAQIGLAILAKAVPQVNILMTSFPLTISVGLFFLALSLDLMLPYFRGLFEDAGKNLVYTWLPLLR